MNIRKPLLTAAGIAVVLSAAALLPSCSDDNKGPHYGPDQTFQQILRVEEWNDGVINAFADFMAIEIQTGKLVSCELERQSSITANGVKLTYNYVDPNDKYSYAYGERISAPNQEVTFVFTRKPGLTFTNTVKLNNTPFIRLPSTTILENGTHYTYTSSLGVITNSAISIYVVAKDGKEAGKRYEADIFNDTYSFQNVPAGNYVLQSTATDSYPVKEQNGTSGGTMYSTKVFEVPNVRFK